MNRVRKGGRQQINFFVQLYRRQLVECDTQTLSKKKKRKKKNLQGRPEAVSFYLITTIVDLLKIDNIQVYVILPTMPVVVAIL